MTGALAIIPARGGSKGVPRKNLHPFAGRPLIAHVIEAARAARRVGQVAVSTDDGEIAAVSAALGARIIHRPAELSSDLASSESALLHALDTVEVEDGALPPVTVFLQCTSPLTRAEDIDRAVEILIEREADSVFAAQPFHGFVWTQDAQGRVSAVNHDASFRPRRQDRRLEFLETGAVYAMRTEGFRRNRHRFFGRLAVLEMPMERSVDIDTLFDFAIAEAMLEKGGSEDGVRPSAMG